MEVRIIKKRIKVLVILFFMIEITMVGLSILHINSDKEDRYINKEILIGSNSKINNDVIEFIDIIKNRGIIVGDLFVVGKEVWNEGTVIGDILGTNLMTKISGVCKGNVRVITKRLDITGEVYRNLSVITKDLILHEFGVVDGSITVIGDRVEIDGLVSSDVRGKINTLIITGEIKGDVNVEVAKIRFGQNGKVQGNLIYKSSSQILMPESNVHGTITYKRKNTILDKYKVLKKTTLLEAIGYLIEFFTMLFKCI